MVVEGLQKGIDLMKEIRAKHDLGLIETFDIKSFQLKVAVFHTDEDIFPII